MLKNALSRKTRFHARIHLEREVLGIVNSTLSLDDMQLSGMTREAIISWEMKAKERFEAQLVHTITSCLISIGRKAELLADDSRDVFKADDRTDPKAIDLDFKRLRELVASVKLI